jgi:hypothetical protein
MMNGKGTPLVEAVEAGATDSTWYEELHLTHSFEILRWVEPTIHILRYIHMLSMYVYIYTYLYRYA